MTDKPTGRISYPHITKPADGGKTEQVHSGTGRWGDDFDPAEFQRTLQEMLDKIEIAPKAHLATANIPDGSKVIFVSGDYSAIEAHALAVMLHESGDPVIMDMQSSGGQIAGVMERRFFPMYDRQFVPKEPAVKQNGRSAAYLQHDRTKRHGRR